jgi:hypothetical protein
MGSGMRRTYRCPHCDEPIKMQSFRTYGPFEPRLCPHCGGDRWTPEYAGKKRAERIIFGVIAFLAAAVAGTMMFGGAIASRF